MLNRIRRMTPLALSACIVCILISTGCGRQESHSLLSRELAGVWTSKDPRYQGRSMELSPAFIIVVTGPHDAPSVEMIDRVETEAKGTDTHYTIYSTDYLKGNHSKMNADFSAANGGEIRFRNQSQAWTRSPKVQNIFRTPAAKK
jgi:hypothetical protein